MTTIRAATVGDAEAVAELARQLGHPATDAALVAANLARIAGDATGLALVALDDDGCACGFARAVTEQFVVDAPFAELAALVVADSARSRGVGKALLAAVETWTREAGFTSLTIRSNVIRTRAHQFYLREGCSEKKRHGIRQAAGRAALKPDGARVRRYPWPSALGRDCRCCMTCLPSPVHC